MSRTTAADMSAFIGGLSADLELRTMQPWLYIALYVVAAVVVALTTGLWRRAFIMFGIRPGRMTVERLGLMVSSPSDVTRVNTILRSFAGGFNTMITARSYSACRGHCDSLPVLYQPFAQEGLAMGYVLRQLFRFDSATFEERLVKVRPEFRYLYYVGLGFWSGMRNHDPQRLARWVKDLDPLHGCLCYDGYGFKRAFFDYPRSDQSLRRLDDFAGYAKNAAYQGVGRAFFFLYMQRPDLLVEQIGKLGAYAEDAAAGTGLAAAFVNPDRLELARELATRLPKQWHAHFHLGMCFGLKARAINYVEQFERDMARMSSRVQEAVYASVRECDRVELLVRSEQAPDAYRRWRSRVTEWMSAHIEYPLAGVRESTSEIPGGEQRVSTRADVGSGPRA